VTSLVLDITEKKQAEEMMIKAKEDALAANRAKSEFLATMSHEFRTPLNAILGFSQMMMPEYSGRMEADKYVDYAKDIHRSGKLMLSLVNDVLDVAEIEAGERRLNKEFVDVGCIVTSCVKNLEPAVRQAGVEVTQDLPDIFPPFRADGRALSQIVLNLLTNAVKFTQAGGRITVSAGVSDRDVIVTISDTGVGIPADTLPNICEPFSRSNPHTSQVGTGLGLSIVKSLVDLHAGTLDIVSEVGVGTTVTVTMPRD